MSEAVHQEDEENYDLEILEIFLEEGAELVDTIAALYQEWRANTSDLKKAHELQRAYHTMKGGSRMAGVFRLGDFSFEMEHYYEKIANGTLAPSDAVFNLLERCHERTAQIIKQLTENSTCTRPTDLIHAIQHFGDGSAVEEISTTEEVIAPSAEESIVEESIAEEESFDSLFDEAMQAELTAEPIEAEQVVEERAAIEEPIIEAPAIEEASVEEAVATEVVTAVEKSIAEEESFDSMFDEAMRAELTAEPIEAEEIVEAVVAIEEPVMEAPAIEEASVEETVITEAAAVVEENAAEKENFDYMFDEAMQAELAAEPIAVEETVETVAAIKEPTTEEPVTEEPVIEEASVEQTVIIESAAVAEESVAEEESFDSMFDEAMQAELAAEPIAVEETVETVAALKEPTTEEPTTEEQVTEEPVIEEASVEETVTTETVTVVEESIIEEVDSPLENVASVADEIIAEPIIEFTPTPTHQALENEKQGSSESNNEDDLVVGSPQTINQEAISIQVAEEAPQATAISAIPQEMSEDVSSALVQEADTSKAAMSVDASINVDTSNTLQNPTLFSTCCAALRKILLTPISMAACWCWLKTKMTSNSSLDQTQKINAADNLLDANLAAQKVDIAEPEIPQEPEIIQPEITKNKKVKKTKKNKKGKRKK